MKHHHRVARDEALGKAQFEFGGELLAAREIGRQHVGAHLLVILQRHGGDGVGVGPAFALEARAGLRKVGAFGQQACQLHAVFEAAVQALAVEGHDGVRGIADQERAPAMPGPAVQRGELALGMARILRIEVGQQPQRVGKLRGEEGARGPRRVQRFETGHCAARRQEQRGGEAAIGVGQGNEHVAAARPDMQRIALERVAAVRGRRDQQFLVVMIERRTAEPAPSAAINRPTCSLCSVPLCSSRSCSVPLAGSTSTQRCEKRSVMPGCAAAASISAALRRERLMA